MDRQQPVLLHGVDGVAVGARMLPPLLHNHYYHLQPGQHLFWLSSPADYLYPFPIPIGTLRCYVMEAELVAGGHYRLLEESGNRRALLLREPGGEVVAAAPLVDEFLTGTRACRWATSRAPSP